MIAPSTLFAGPPDVDFERDIAPMLVRRCVTCHNASDPAGELDLTSADAVARGGASGNVIEPGDPGSSYLLERLIQGEMPPAGKGQPLTREEVERLRQWIIGGALWPTGRQLTQYDFTTDERAGLDWWSLRPVRRPEVPNVEPAQWVRNPIDAFVLRGLTDQGLTPSPEADRATLVRRVTFDLIGLPPSPEEIAAFVADDSPEAYERLVDRLLASPHYGERWARHWLDVVRFGESNGYETNTARPNAWPYRDYVIRALNEDVPYDRFVLEQLAGDQTGSPEGTGFLVGGAHDIVQSPEEELTRQQRQQDLDDMAATTAGTFLGLTVGCAKCHDHKFDPISQRDYYALNALLSGVHHGERPLYRDPHHQEQEGAVREQLAAAEADLASFVASHEPVASPDFAGGPPRRGAVHARRVVDRFAPTDARFVRLTILATNSLEPCIDELEVFSAEPRPRNVAAAAAGAKATASSVYQDGGVSIHQLAHAIDGAYGNDHSWISSEAGSGWLQVELPTVVQVDRVEWARDREGKFADRVATRYRLEVATQPEEWRTMATSEDRAPYAEGSTLPAIAPLEHLDADETSRQAELTARVEQLRGELAKLAPLTAYVGTFAEPETVYRLYRGEVMQRREETLPGGLSAVAPALEIAPSSTDGERRLALAGWIADERNPLTARVTVNRIWQHHFGAGLVHSPSDFGFHGGPPSHPELLDWLATEFVRGGWQQKKIHRRMVTSATYRQSSLTRPSAAQVDANNRWLWRYAPRRLEAEAIRDGMLAVSGALDRRMGGPGYDVFEPNTNYVKVYLPKASFGADEFRRMIYQNKPRLQQDALFGQFDCPDATQAVARRNVSTTALQALNLLNAPFAVGQAERFAERLEREASTTAERVDRGFRLALGRAPDTEEHRAGVALVEQSSLTAFCRVLFNANEFVYVQ